MGGGRGRGGFGERKKGHQRQEEESNEALKEHRERVDGVVVFFL